MLALEMLRMAVDIATWGMGRAAFLVYRVVVVAGLVAGGFAAGAVLVREHAFARINLGEGVLERLLDVLVQLNTSVFGYVGDAVSAVRRPDPRRERHGRQPAAGRGGVGKRGRRWPSPSSACMPRPPRRVARRERRNYQPSRRRTVPNVELGAPSRSAEFASAAVASRVAAAPARSPGGNWSAPAVTGAACSRR